MADVITSTPEANYATRDNILFPGKTAKATAAATRAKAAIEARHVPAGLTLSAAPTIKANNE